MQIRNGAMCRAQCAPFNKNDGQRRPVWTQQQDFISKWVRRAPLASSPMLNRLWASLILIAAFAGAVHAILHGGGTINAMAEALFDSAKTGVDMSIGLISALALWLGVFQIAEDAGLVRKLARLLAPILGRLMPDVPRDHPAFASIGMNVSMSMLGIDNGALPSGLKAMEQLESLNATAATASRAQQMFLVYMTTSVTVFPVSILGYRVQAGAAHPADVFLPLLIASYVGLFVGLAYMAVVQRIRLFDPVLLVGSLLFVTALCAITWFVGSLAPKEASAAVALLGNAILLFAVVLFVAVAWLRRVPVYDSFLRGAKQGFGLAIDLIPYVVGMLVAIGLLRASGAFSMLLEGLAWCLTSAGLDARWALGMPQGIMKSFSGGGANAMMLDAFKTQGPDSFAGHLSSVIQGASDTTFYILAACAGAAKLKNLGHAVTGSVIADIASFIAAVFCAQLFFG